MTMALFCCKKLSSFPHLYDYASSSLNPHLLAAGILQISTTAAVTGAADPPPQNPHIVQFLVDSCGLSPDKATRACKYLARLKSPDNPGSVIRFLKQSGFDDARIRGAISNYPPLLLADVEKTMKPKLQELRQLGFSDSELPQLIHLCPFAVTRRNIKPKIEFWRAFYPTNEDLLKAGRKDRNLLTASMKRILPNLSLLRRCSLSDSQIANLILRAPRLITGKLNSIEELVRRVEELGVSPGSGMFYNALRSLHGISATNAKAKIRLLESFGCSIASVKSGIQKCPTILTLSEKMITEKMDFLTKKAGCEPSYVISRLALMGYSLERKLIPRLHVLQILKSKGLAAGDRDLSSAMSMSDNKFLDKFILPHKETVPELHEAYIAACAGKVTIQSNCYGEKVMNTKK